jgi:hypothetical protein
MAVIEIAKIQVRRGQELQTGIPQLDPGELGWAEDTQHLYIGKRIDEGANSDENTRILTENDLENIFNLINTTSSSVLTYEYRDGILPSTGIRTVSRKLDDNVSVADFSGSIYYAIADLFAAPEDRRELKIPAGTYVISNTIPLPPYTTIVGEGSGLTTIISTATIFKTVDAAGNDYNNGMSTGASRSRSVKIKGISLVHSTPVDAPLLNLDNTLDAIIEDVEFKIDTTATLVSHGIGIEIRGTGGGLGSGSVNLCENIHISKCKFNTLATAIDSTGSVIRPVITDCVFSNLDRGIAMYTIDSTAAPSNGEFTNNRFENIVREAIFVGTSSNRANHISENNFFIQVGNSTTLSDNTTTAASPIISFFADGNRSVNDYFHRQVFAHSTTNTNFYYNPLVKGVGVIDVSSVFTATVAGSTTSLVERLSLIGQEQMLSVRYKLYNNNYSRKGNLIVNIASDNSASISDYYNYSYTNTVTDATFVIDSTYVAKNYLVLNCNNSLCADPYQIEYQISALL